MSKLISVALLQQECIEIKRVHNPGITKTQLARLLCFCLTQIADFAVVANIESIWCKFDVILPEVKPASHEEVLFISRQAAQLELSPMKTPVDSFLGPRSFSQALLPELCRSRT